MKGLSAILPAGALWLGFFGFILLAWAVLFAAIAASPAANVPAGIWQTLCIGAGSANLGSLFLMWLIMSAAMMMPTFVPALRTFVNLQGPGATRPLDAVFLIAGYASLWAGGAFLGALAQKLLSDVGLMAPDGSALSLWFAATLLLLAGLYQFSVLKAACLSKCRMPLTFFMQHWAPGPSRAFAMGARLGAVCLGCCWALMALGFVGGTMNLVWMGAATLFMTMEKLPQVGQPLTRPAGYLLIAASGVCGLVALTS